MIHPRLVASSVSDDFSRTSMVSTKCPCEINPTSGASSLHLLSVTPFECDSPCSHGSCGETSNHTSTISGFRLPESRLAVLPRTVFACLPGTAPRGRRTDGSQVLGLLRGF